MQAALKVHIITHSRVYGIGHKFKAMQKGSMCPGEYSNTGWLLVFCIMFHIVLGIKHAAVRK